MNICAYVYKCVYWLVAGWSYKCVYVHMCICAYVHMCINVCIGWLLVNRICVYMCILVINGVACVGWLVGWLYVYIYVFGWLSVGAVCLLVDCCESREQRAESREQRAESREQRAESREQRAGQD